MNELNTNKKTIYPKIIQKNGFGFLGDVKKVGDLDLRKEEIDIKEIEGMFEIPFGDYNNERFVLKPIDVLNNPEKYKIEYERTMKADLKYPIDIMGNKKINKFATLDGLHRALKAKILGHNKIIVRKVPEELLDKIIKKYL